jgi:UDP-glucose 4-epimerase
MDNLKGSTILVTGANGFLGRHLLARLKQDGVNVHALSRHVPAEDGAVQWHEADLTDAARVEQLAEAIQPDVIYQLSSASIGGQDAQFVLPTFENDLRATVNTLLAAKACGARVILVASLEEPVPGRGSPAPGSPYAAAKACCTLYGQMFHQVYGVPVTMLRPYMAYGPGQKPYKVIPYTILSLLKGEAPRIGSGGRPVDWVYVEDVIAAFISAAARPEAVGAAIDLGSGTVVSVREAVESIHRLIPGSPAPLFGAAPERARETVRCAETQSARLTLGWEATTPLHEGLARTVDWYRRNGVTA